MAHRPSETTAEAQASRLIRVEERVNGIASSQDDMKDSIRRIEERIGDMREDLGGQKAKIGIIGGAGGILGGALTAVISAWARK